MHTIRVKHFFDAAHQLPDTETLVTKACARLHGHTYAVVVEAQGELNGGMVVDFKAIKQVIDELDHYFLNDILTVPTTAENIAEYLAGRIFDKLGLKSTVSICEGYKGEHNSNWVSFSNIFNRKTL